ncbi:MAG TPA: hypothetical protein VKP30_28750 [Polyangiaceae bacterium]|nr:hypothetical protein [Polyangiaceae bacterium]
MTGIIDTANTGADSAPGGAMVGVGAGAGALDCGLNAAGELGWAGLSELALFPLVTWP